MANGIVVRVPPDVVERLDKVRAAEYRSRAAMVGLLVREGLDRRQADVKREEN
jgi:metal-responsive CopG/Arc/MetJ family transcriptional regulator